MQQEEEGDLILSLVVEHGGLGQMKRKEGWTLLQTISCCSEYLYNYIKQRMSRLRLEIMGTFVTHASTSELYKTFYERNGLKEGVVKLYRNHHKVPDELTYENGKLNGQARIYRWETPILWKTFSYENDQMNGQSIEYHKNGRIHYIEYYVEDTLTKEYSHRISYDVDGSELWNNWQEVEAYHKAKKQKTE